MACERCGREAPTQDVSFHQHIGLIVLWHHVRTAGRFCRICIDQVFWRSFLVTLFFGWWGVMSAFITLFFALPMNVVSYLKGTRLPYPDSQEAKLAPRDRARARELRFGTPALTLGLFAVLHFGLLGALTSVYLVLGATPFGMPYWTAPLCVLLPDALLTIVYAILAVRAVARVAAGTTGRARLFVLSWAAIVRAIGMIVVAAILALALTDPSVVTFGFGAREVLPLGWAGLLDSLETATVAQGTFVIGVGALAITAVAALLELGAAVTAWFLTPSRFRHAFWIAFDASLLVAFVLVTLLLPIRPPDDAPHALFLPVLRLSVTTFAAIRFLARAIPIVLDGIEQSGFRLLVAARLLRARKSGFLTAIGALSILAVAFSSCTLTTTLSVMGGFRNDLKQKILGNNAHVLIDREHGTFTDWQPTLETVRAQDHVVGASPYVSGEVMITSATNLSGAILRGIDPRTIGRVTELPRNIRHGSLEYLEHPERLLRLRAEETGRGLLAPPIELRPPRSDPGIDDGTPPPPIPERRGFLDDAQDILGEAPPDPERERIQRDIQDFLLDTPPPSAAPSEPEVLPGLIVGQELARTLRLHVGDRVDVVSPFGELGPSGPMPKSRPFRVAGIFYSGMYEFDMKMAYTTLEAAQQYLNVDDGIHGIEVKVDDPERAEPVARSIASAIGRRDVRVRAWQEVNRSLFGALQLEKLAMFITLGIAILVASFCIVGSLTLMVQEKRKEVGILRAMGANGEQIVAVFMAQGLMIGLLGALVGLGLGYLACFAAEHFGVGLNAEVYYIDKLPVHIDPVEFALTGVAAVVVCLLATIYPALLASRLRPVDALRYT